MAQLLMPWSKLTRLGPAPQMVVIRRPLTWQGNLLPIGADFPSSTVHSNRVRILYEQRFIGVKPGVTVAEVPVKPVVGSTASAPVVNQAAGSSSTVAQPATAGARRFGRRAS